MSAVSGSGRAALLAAMMLVPAVVPSAVGAAGNGSRPVETGSPLVRDIQDVAGRSPFIGRDCNVATPYYTSAGGKEGEPFVAVNPHNPANRIAAWMDATRATVNTAHSNGGRVWRLSIPPGIDGCTGNHTSEWEASGDPWISFGPDGLAYLSTLTWAHFATPPFSDYVSVIHVQTSADGGRTWSDPVLVGDADSVSDKPMVLADPYDTDVAYEIWRNQSFGLPVGSRGRTRLYFAVTTDRGSSWSDPVTIARGTRSDFFGNPQLSVLRDGTLVATSSLANADGSTNLLAWRSSDRGRHWQGPVQIRQAAAGGLEPICGQPVAGADTTSAGQHAVVNGRSIVLVSSDGQAAAAGNGKLYMSRSNDGGRTWQTQVILRSAHPLLLQGIASDRKGSLGLVWDQINTERIDCAAHRVPARSLFAESSDAGGTWSSPVTLGARQWNLASGIRGAGGFSGYFLGDYQNLAAQPGGFLTITVQGRPLTTSAPPVTGANGVMVADIVTNPAR